MRSLAFLSGARRFVEWWWGLRDARGTDSRWASRWFVAAWLSRALALVVALSVGVRITRVVRTAPTPTPLSANPLFGISDAKRRAIFLDLASHEPRARTESAEKFPGEPWSIEDERAAHERDRASDVAQTNAVNLSQVYLILDEGIREKWAAPNKPLDGAVVPLKPRFR